MPFDRIFLDELSARNDIVEIVSQYVQLKKSGANYFGLCPFHNEKNRFVFGFAGQADLSLLRLRRRRRCHYLYYEGGRSDLPGCGTLSRRAGGHADTRTG